MRRFKKGDFVTAPSGAFGIVVDKTASTPAFNIEVRWSDEGNSTVPPQEIARLKLTTLDEMKEAIAPEMMEGLGDGAAEDIVWFGYKGLNERTRKEIRELFLEIIIDG